VTQNEKPSSNLAEEDRTYISAHDDLFAHIADIEFNGILSGKQSDPGKGKPGSKMRLLKKMLDDAEIKRKRLNDLKTQGSVGQNRAREEQWTDALADAAGDRTVGDTRKLKKAIKRREKSKEKSAREWQVSSALKTGTLYVCS
jgi:hypothetical protein